MNDLLNQKIKFLGLEYLATHLDVFLKEATKKTSSYSRFISEIIEKEYEYQKEKKRLARIARAKIPEKWIMETFPFQKQPRLKKKLVMEIYDSMKYMTQSQELIFIGPTGCGKTGLGNSFLTHAINDGYRGRYFEFMELCDLLFQALGDHSEKQLIARLQNYDIIMIDELGYPPMKPEVEGLFFELIKKRHQKKTTLITTQLGFEEWGSFIKNKHLNAALLDRITVNCTVFNMKQCISLRPKNIIYATKCEQSSSQKEKAIQTK